MRAFRPGGLLSPVLLTASLINRVQASHSSLPLPLRQIYQFSNPTYLQSIHVRSNGDILVTTVWPNASIYSVSGATTNTPTVSLVHTFDDINAVTGIIETQPDVIAFLGGNQSSLGIGINGTFGVWELDLRPAYGSNPSKPIIKELVLIPNGGLLAGVVAVPDSPTTLLVSDSTLGLVWRVDTLTRQYALAIQDATMHSPPWAVSQFGVNGVHVHNGYLYWTNSYEATIYRIPITGEGYPTAEAKVEAVKTVHSIYLDNFTFGPQGGSTIWAATNADNRLIAITPDGNISFVEGGPDQLTLAGSVATAFGKLCGDTNTLYVVTSGGIVFPINGTVTEGGKIVAIDTTSFF
jgi:hypothetical protein